MLFNSFDYILFLFLTFFLYICITNKLRSHLLLFASCFFYFYWKVEYGVLLLTSISVNFYFGKKISMLSGKKLKKAYLFVGITFNVITLFTFKYLGLFSDLFSTDLNLILPIGISFYTFQILSYLLEVYYGRILPEKNLIYFALYVSFFPQLIAGPIERPQKLLPQIKNPFIFDYDLFLKSLVCILTGLIKKMVIADRLFPVVNMAFGNPENCFGSELIVASIFFSFEIFYDFSGYTDIAVGSAGLFGIKLSKNFNSPYFSESLKEFWKRWHITLSTWFRDYVYIPLGGSRSGFFAECRNILFTFALAGIWHGAGLTFFVWGILHGLILILERVLTKGCRKLNLRGIYFLRAWKKILIFTVVTLLWIPFRARSLPEAELILSRVIMNDWSNFITRVSAFLYRCDVSRKDLFVLVFSVALLKVSDRFQEKEKVQNDFTLFLKCSFYGFLLIWLISFYKTNTMEFVYFQF